MNLSFSTLGCPDWPFPQVVEQAKALGFDALEIRGIGPVLRSEEIPALKAENAAATARMLADAGLRIQVLGTSAALHNAASLPAALDEARAALAICNRMGIPAIRVFGDARPVDGSPPPRWQQVAEGLLLLCDAAVEMGGAQVWMEVHGAVNTVEILSPILAHAGSHPAFGLIWDIQHSYRVAGNDIAPFYELVRPYVRHMHIKDGRETPQGFQTTLAGEGDIDIAGIVRRLQADGYMGCYSFEWEKRWQPQIQPPEVAFPAYARYMRGLL